MRLRGPVVSRQIKRQELDRHVPIQPRVTGPIDDAHPAAAQLADDLIRASFEPGASVIGGAIVVLS